jgi:hypothetical protein
MTNDDRKQKGYQRPKIIEGERKTEKQDRRTQVSGFLEMEKIPVFTILLVG